MSQFQPYSAASFPTLEISEIVDQFRSLGCIISEQDILHPTPGRIQAIYEWWMKLQLNVSSDDCYKAAERQLDVMENSEIHLEAMFIGVFQLTLNQLLVRCAVDDFTTRDLTAPTTPRVARILSGFLNFWLYGDEQKAEYLDAVIAEERALSEREDEMIRTNQELRDKINKIKEERKANALKIPATKQLVLQGANDMAHYKNESDKIAKKIEEIKNDLARATVENTELTKSNTNQSIEINRLKGQIVQSPDRMRANLVDLKNAIERDTDALKVIEQKERSMVAQIAGLQRYETDLAQCIRIMDEWQIDLGKMKETTSRYRKHSDMYEALVNERADLEKQIVILDRKIQFSREEAERFDGRCETRRTQAKQRKRVLEDQNIMLGEQKRVLDLQAAGKNREAVDVENQIREIHATLFKELDRGETDFERIKGQMSLYSIKLNKALDSIDETTSKRFEATVLAQ